jgi:4-carboxymuconolactone decarboxylase
MTERTDIAAAGRRRRERAQGPRAGDLQKLLVSIDSELAGMADELIFGHLWNRPALDHEEQMLVAITALVMQDNSAQLRNYFFGALQDNIPASKLRDVIMMCAVYGGFPVTINAMTLLHEVCDAMRRQGVTIDLDQEPDVEPPTD